MTTLDKDGTVWFSFFRPAAREVSLAGDFNQWAKQLKLQRDANGWWTLRLALEPGEYTFHYVADGEWYTDFASNGVEATALGWNSLLVVPERPAGSAKEKEQTTHMTDALLVA